MTAKSPRSKARLSQRGLSAVQIVTGRFFFAAFFINLRVANEKCTESICAPSSWAMCWTDFRQGKVCSFERFSRSSFAFGPINGSHPDPSVRTFRTTDELAGLGKTGFPMACVCTAIVYTCFVNARGGEVHP